ncbi:Cytochrome P450 2F1, variant 2 [Chamberlinius hualienensis]
MTPLDVCWWFFLVVILMAMYWYLTVPPGLPPGSAGLPIVGYLPFLNRHVYLTLSALGKKYGNLYHLYFGNQLVIVLNDYETIKEALVHHGAVFSGRPPIFGAPKSTINIENLGVSAAEGDLWHHHRRFILSKMKDFGIFKNEEEILDEINYLIKEMMKTSGRSMDVKMLLSKSLTNIINMFLFGKRLDYYDPIFNKSLFYLDELVRMIPNLGLFMFFPWLHHFSPIRRIVNIQTMIDINDSWLSIINDFVSGVKKTFVTGQSDNYVQAVLTHQDDLQSNDNNGNVFSDKVLTYNMRDLIGAGGETTATTLMWTLVYMTKYPDVQKKVQKELDEVFGHDKTPSWNCRKKTPYTEATLLEIHRLASISPMSVQRRLKKRQ